MGPVQSLKTLAVRTLAKTREYAQTRIPFQIRRFIRAPALSRSQVQLVKLKQTIVLQNRAKTQAFVPIRWYLRITSSVTAAILTMGDYAMLELILAVRIHVKMAAPAVIKTAVRGTNATASTLMKVQTAMVKRTLVHRTPARIQESA